MTEKHALYESLGVTEYWQHDPTGKYLPPRLLGHRLNAKGAYEPVPLETRPDGTRRGKSKVLSLHLCLDAGRLRLFDPATGKFLPTNQDKDRIIEDKERMIQELDFPPRHSASFRNPTAKQVPKEPTGRWCVRLQRHPLQRGTPPGRPWP